MKRRDLLKHLSEHGCTLLREGANIRGGTIQIKTGEARCLGTLKSRKAWLARYAETWEFLNRKPRHSSAENVERDTPNTPSA